MKLFELVEETVDLLNQNIAHYSLVEEIINDYLIGIVEESENYIGSTSRIKSENSLRNKIIKRKYYLEYDNAEDILDNLSDVIGITLECRFKEDEIKLYEKIQKEFIQDDQQFSPAKTHDKIYMNVKSNQPEKQENGFEIYRIDGYYFDGVHRVNFELQIKSLINTFWSGIEHEIIYKNNNFLMFDSFLKELLGSVKNNLDIIDSQLTHIYREMTHKGNDSIGMDGTNFKSFLAKEINNLFSLKLKETAEIDINIKKISALISHYLFLEEFVKSESPQLIMIDYFEKLDLLSNTDMDFTVNIEIDDEISNGDSFQLLFGQYCLSTMNVDFDWHVLFSMLFMLQEGDAIVKFNKFITFIKQLIFEPTWYNKSVEKIEKYEGCRNIKDNLYALVAQALIRQKSVSVIYEENLFEVMMLVRSFVDELYNLDQTESKIDIEKKYKELNEELDIIFES